MSNEISIFKRKSTTEVVPRGIAIARFYASFYCYDFNALKNRWQVFIDQKLTNHSLFISFLDSNNNSFSICAFTCLKRLGI